ncbi:citramalate synthase [Caulifigura coniformis]
MMRIQLYDTTLRDGSQGEGVNFSLQDKLLITSMLDELGFDFIEGGFPASNEKDSEYFQRVAEGVPELHGGGTRPLANAKVVAFGMTRRKGIAASEDQGLQALVKSKAPVCTVVGKTWDLHVTEVLRVSLEENLAMIRDSIAYLKSEGRTVFYDAEHFFDGYQANPDYATKTIRAAIEGGVDMVIFCDTNGGSLPEKIAATIDSIRPHVTVPFGIHCHNDCEVAVANSLKAVDSGAVQVQGTINGIGERCGNADLVSVAANLALKKGRQVLAEGGVGRLTEISRYVYELANMNFRNGQPFVGRSAFAHKGGMHVHAVNRIAHSYEHIDPAVVGNERRILVSELSGRSNIMAKTTKFNLGDDNALMKRILDRVVELEAEGYQFEAAEASFDLLVKKEIGQYEPKFRRLHYHVVVQMDASGLDSPGARPALPMTQATVKVQVGNRIELVAGEGDGPVNALDNALRKALVPAYPQLSTMRLVDYKVRVINSTEGTAAKVRVVIESADDQDVWSTIGVSENVIEASWQALADAIDYKLLKDNGQLT